ncbi:hypothetical protein [Asticcacaulis solisilvae]|uniref:hypothetical protein n=1 Tax=Asticcacaulis solisilvae TaxID=1217274 RepID=UPI003FD795E9
MSRLRLAHEGGSGPHNHNRPRSPRKRLLPMLAALIIMVAIAAGMAWLALR